MQDNVSPVAAAVIPQPVCTEQKIVVTVSIDISGAQDPVVEIINQRTGETVKAGRVNAGIHSPGVFDANAGYTVRVGVPEGNGQWWTSKDLKPSRQRGDSRLAVAVK